MRLFAKPKTKPRTYKPAAPTPRSAVADSDAMRKLLQELLVVGPRWVSGEDAARPTPLPLRMAYSELARAGLASSSPIGEACNEYRITPAGVAHLEATKPASARPSTSAIGTQEPFAPWMVEGARVHNFGDVCNLPKNGAIVRVWADQWANNVEVRWDDDGGSDVLTTNAFRPGPLGSAPRCVQLYSYELRPDAQEHLEAIAAAHGITLEEALNAAIYRMARGL